jgi:hypothetical protein
VGESSGGAVHAAGIFSRVWALDEEGALVVACAWCGRIRVDERCVAVPNRVVAAIDAPNVLSHSICGDCSEAALEAVGLA